MKKTLSVFLSFLMVLGLFSTLTVTAAAAERRKTGTITDNGLDDGSVIVWEITYDALSGNASLVVTGEGEIPNAAIDDTWHKALYETGCMLTEATIGEGITSLMEAAFAGQERLSKVTLPSTLQHIGDGAFSQTAVQSLYLPKGMSDISGNTFLGSSILYFTVDANNPYYKSYNNVIYTKDMKEIVYYPSVKDSKISNPTFIIPSTVEIIGPAAFAGSYFTYLDIPSNVKTIGKDAFNSSKLQEVYINNGVESVYNCAFVNCRDLKTVHTPTSLKYVGMFSFGYSLAFDYEGLKNILDEKGIAYGVIDESNLMKYVNLAGFGNDFTVFLYYEPAPKVKLYGPSDSAVEKYADNNGVGFVPSQALTPRLLSATSLGGGVKVSWRPSGDATGYAIYRKGSSTSWFKIATVNDGNANSYIDYSPMDSETNIYTVRAINSKGQSYCDPYGVSSYYLKSPKITVITNRVGGIYIDWEDSLNAQYYYIYRKDYTGDSWHYLKCVSGLTSNYIDTTVEDNNEYEYFVRVNNGISISGYNSNGVKWSYVKNPTFRVYNTTTGVNVRWSEGLAVDRYRIYRKTSNASWRLLDDVPGSEMFFIDNTARRGVNYTYTVRAVRNGFYSSYVPSGANITSISAPTKLSLQNRGSGVMVNWNKCEGAEGYYVYKKTASGSWLRIATVKGTSFLDTKVRSGNKYIYTVKAYSGRSMSTYLLNGKSIQFLSMPRLLDVNSTRAGIKLDFSSVNGAAAYNIYRKAPNSNWRFIGRVNSGKGNSYLDKTATKGASYIYTVRAVNGSFISSFYSNNPIVKDKY